MSASIAASLRQVSTPGTVSDAEILRRAPLVELIAAEEANPQAKPVSGFGSSERNTDAPAAPKRQGGNVDRYA
jgi:hypothetical protein